jgi:hypothetical protein
MEGNTMVTAKRPLRRTGFLIVVLLACVLCQSFFGAQAVFGAGKPVRHRAFAIKAGKYYKEPSSKSTTNGKFAQYESLTSLVYANKSKTWMSTVRKGKTVYVKKSAVVLLPLANAKNKQIHHAITKKAGKVYQYPSFQSPVVASYEKRAAVAVVKRYDSAGKWAAVTHNGRKGYAALRNFALIANKTSRSTALKRVKLSAKKYYYPCASTEATPVGRWAVEATITARAHTAKGHWLYTTVEGKRVYFTRTNASVSYHVRVAKLAKLNTQLEKRLNKLVNDSMTKSQKLRTVYLFTVTSNTYKREEFKPKKGWEEPRAYEMLTTRKGNCYSYAAAFAYLAKAVGYENAKPIPSKIQNRNGKQPPHCWVEIKIAGKTYVFDPELQYALKINLYKQTYKTARIIYIRPKK